MKYTILLTLCLWTISGYAQVNSSMPPEANIFYNKAIEIIRPEIKKLVHTSAMHCKKEKPDAALLITYLKRETILKKLSHADIEGIAVLVMVQATKNTDEELKKMVMLLRNNPGQESIDATKALADFKSFLAYNINLLMDKTSISQESVINNLKQ